MSRVSNRASGGTLAAFLILAAIVGFAGGAYLGAQSGNEANASPNPPAATTPSDDTTRDPNEGDDSDDDPGEGEDDEEPAADGDVVLTIEESSVSPGGRINYTVRTNPPEEGVSFQLQRSVDGGPWEDFPVSPRETNANGEFSAYVESSRSGENAFRVVRVDDDSVVSEPATVTIG